MHSYPNTIKEWYLEPRVSHSSSSSAAVQLLVSVQIWAGLNIHEEAELSLTCWIQRASESDATFDEYKSRNVTNTHK